ncbi:hypothetical protein [Fodinicola feengrottensis]|uniref:Uncharacterized protein n=1 Tax=Fodinicola feengrottensis TaxID=435914 RepID=A0ABN2IDB6_9ACTN|nr:hypothetical protein [Fodinicola feengrottensis]
MLGLGEYLVTFGDARTWHRLVTAIQDSGFQIRDTIAWLYGQGLPKTTTSAKP